LGENRTAGDDIKDVHLVNFMKCVRVTFIIALGLTLVACGGTPSNMPIAHPPAGAWSLALADSAWQPLGSFTFEISQSDTTLTGSSLNFPNVGRLSECFAAGTVMTGQVDRGMLSTGTMEVTMSMSWTDTSSVGTNTLTMQGAMTRDMDSASGTFTLTGETPGCMSQTGTFTINKRRVT
jgi:hypothetical protein